MLLKKKIHCAEPDNDRRIPKSNTISTENSYDMIGDGASVISFIYSRGK